MHILQKTVILYDFFFIKKANNIISLKTQNQKSKSEAPHLPASSSLLAYRVRFCLLLDPLQFRTLVLCARGRAARAVHLENGRLVQPRRLYHLHLLDEHVVQRVDRVALLVYGLGDWIGDQVVDHLGQALACRFVAYHFDHLLAYCFDLAAAKNWL